ncbi:multiheme c-type cytochrome [Bdellovibrionota bacterium FG-1]
MASLLGATVFLAALPGGGAGAAVLVHSNDVLGDIEPCGCRTNPQGGMARKFNFVSKLDGVLQLDAGDLLFASDSLPELLAGQAELQAAYLLRAMALVHHDAVVPGEKDFALGLKTFEKLIHGSSIRFLAANLVRKNGKPLFHKSAVFTRKSLDGKPFKVGVIGLVGQDLPFPKELRVLPAIAAAKREVAVLRKKVDWVVLLTHQGLEHDKELAQAVPGIDVIIGGHSQSFLQEPLRVGKTVIFQSSFRNQYVGVLPLQKAVQIENYKLVGLDAGYDSPPQGPPTAMDKLVSEFKKAIGELNTREDARLMASAAALKPGDATQYQTFPKCAECHLKQFDFWRKTPHALALHTLIEKDQIRNKECLTCHTLGLGQPKGFSAIQQMVEVKRTADPQASEPKIVSVSPEDFARYLKTIHDAKDLKAVVQVSPDDESHSIRRSVSSIHRAWAPVQCENCHQPGQGHPFSGTYSKKVEKTVCLKCHTAERAPEWYTAAGAPDWLKIEAKRTLMTCPTGDLDAIED